MKKGNLHLFSRGFTIVELLVVLVIIAILATITFVSYTGIIQKAAAATLQSDLKNASTELALYNATNSSYPADVTAAQAANVLPSSNNTTYQYTLTDGNYCLSATSTKAGSYAYHFSSLVGTIEAGVCEGHAAPGAATIEVLIVAGGGGGASGGGGGGGYYYNSSYNINSSQDYTVNVGQGGIAGSGYGGAIQPTNGGDSSFGETIIAGGGKGGVNFNDAQDFTGGNGANGGGGAYSGASTTYGGTGSLSYNGGGNAGYKASPYAAGGGGGAGGSGGGAQSSSIAGVGGLGVVNPITGSTIGQNISGVYYIAGGGGGGVYGAGTGGVGGNGGGGAGSSSGVNGFAGLNNTGGGGGGGPLSKSGGAGGSGVVIVRYKTSTLVGFSGGSVTYDGDYTIHTFTSDGVFLSGGKTNHTMAYNYTGDSQAFVAPATADYKFELWGASGGDVPIGGKGAYTSGTLHLTSGTTLYIYVGQSGVFGSEASSFDGGGGIGLPYSTYLSAYSGGGATDIRLTGGAWNLADGLKSRIMVAGGGGGGAWGTYVGGYAGGLTGGGGQLYSAGSAAGGSQTTGGGFGFGQKAANVPGFFTMGAEGRGGGGGGYYGGYAQQVTGNSTNAAGGGGSSFISGYVGCNAIDATGNATGQANHYSGYIFTDMKMVGGNSTMPNSAKAGTEIGHQGNGYVLINWIQ